MNAFEDFQKSLRKVKTVDDCEAVTTVDAYDDFEAVGGWMTCLDEILDDIKSVKILNQEAQLKGFDIERENSIVAICKSGKKTVRVSLASVEWPKLTKLQKLWLQAWTKKSIAIYSEI
jgi:threonine dehydratase